MITIAIIGKTNTGKSTLFNTLLNNKESTVTKKSNTTIRCIEKKIKNLVLIDTPGIILNNKINTKPINQLIYDSIEKSDIIIINMEEENLTSEDLFLLDINKKKKKILVINKIDKIIEKEKILLLTKNLSDYAIFQEIIPISNIKNINIQKLKEIIKNYHIEKTLKKHIYKKDTLNLKIKDLIRETLLNNLSDEIPYNLVININEIKTHSTTLDIEIKFNKYNYKKIILGQKSKNIINIINTIKKKINKLHKKINKIKINLKYDNKCRNRLN